MHVHLCIVAVFTCLEQTTDTTWYSEIYKICLSSYCQSALQPIHINNTGLLITGTAESNTQRKILNWIEFNNLEIEKDEMLNNTSWNVLHELDKLIIISIWPWLAPL